MGAISKRVSWAPCYGLLCTSHKPEGILCILGIVQRPSLHSMHPEGLGSLHALQDWEVPI